MIYYYHPIFGLQYYNSFGEYIMIDIAEIPENINIENFVKEWEKWQSQVGFSFHTIEIHTPIYSNF